MLPPICSDTIRAGIESLTVTNLLKLAARNLVFQPTPEISSRTAKQEAHQTQKDLQ